LSIAKHGRRLIRKGVLPKCAAFETDVTDALMGLHDVDSVESRIDAHPAQPVLLVHLANGDVFRVTLALVDERR